jgi:phosphotriesterase-related protein
MNRRKFIFNSLAISASGLFFSRYGYKRDQIIMTVNGPVKPEDLGIVLAHEHILVDFGGAENYDPTRWNQHEVVKALLPYLQELKELGFNSFFEFTPEFLGRDPVMLRQLSEESGLNIVTNTGYYGAVDNKYLPSIATDASAEDLAQIWINEYRHGIRDTGIKPGFMKISVNPGPLSDLHKKLVRAAALTHLETGLTIASHTGPAVPAFEQLDILQDLGVHPAAFVWVHAQNEDNWENYLKAAEMGAWVSLDGIQEDNVQQYTDRLLLMKQNKLLDQVLISQDAGWYEPGKPWNGPNRKYTDISNHFIPKLQSNGFNNLDIRQLIEKNPAQAYTIIVRKT